MFKEAKKYSEIIEIKRDLINKGYVEVCGIYTIDDIYDKINDKKFVDKKRFVNFNGWFIFLDKHQKISKDYIYKFIVG